MSSQRSLAILALLLWLGLCGLAYWLADIRATECRDHLSEWPLRASVQKSVMDCMLNARWMRDLAPIAAIGGVLAALMASMRGLRQSASPPAP